MKHLPYNTGKVLIGCRYTPPLLGIRKEVPRDYWVTLVATIAFLVLGMMMVVR